MVSEDSKAPTAQGIAQKHRVDVGFTCTFIYLTLDLCLCFLVHLIVTGYEQGTKAGGCVSNGAVKDC